MSHLTPKNFAFCLSKNFGIVDLFSKAVNLPRGMGDRTFRWRSCSAFQPGVSQPWSGCGGLGYLNMESESPMSLSGTEYRMQATL